MMKVHQNLAFWQAAISRFHRFDKHIFGSSDMLQRNGTLFEEVRPQQFAEKKDGNGVPASSSGSCHGKVWKACKCKACVKEANNGQ